MSRDRSDSPDAGDAVAAEDRPADTAVGALPPESPGIELRPFQPGDADAVAALVMATGLTPRSLEQTFLLLAEDTASRAIVGTVGLAQMAEFGLVRCLTVATSHAGRGLSGFLLQTIELAARGQGLERLYALSASPGLFVRHAWVPAGEPPPELRDTPDWQSSLHDASLQLMVKPLRARNGDELRRAVRSHFAALVERPPTSGGDWLSTYDPDELRALPLTPRKLWTGCGNPLAFVRPSPGDVLLDLGCGAGLDVLRAAEMVSPGGRVIGIDLTPEMLRSALEATAAAGVAGVAFCQGLLERLPIADASIDLVLSNASIHLTVDKAAVFAEAFRVLRPGGRIVVADIVTSRPLPDATRHDPVLLCAGVGGALQGERYLESIRTAGFTSVQVLREVDHATIPGAATRSITVVGRKPRSARPEV